MKLSNTLKAHLACALVQFDYGVYHVISKVALSDGINQLVFCVIRDLIALAILAPVAYFKDRRMRPPLTRTVLLNCAFLGFSGIFANQLLFVYGLSFTSPAYASAMQPGIPVFTFVLTLCMGTERISLKRLSGIAKVGGTLISVLGAVLMVIYKGPVIWGDGSVGLHMQSEDLYGLLFPQLHLWHLGVMCLIGNCFCMAVYLSFQAPLLEKYPAGFTVTAYSYCFGALFMLLSGLVGAHDGSDWVLTRSEYLAVIYSGIVASAVNYCLLTSSNKVLGPALVALYMPLQPLFSSILARVFLNSSLFLGSVLGGLMIVAGLYFVTWGQTRAKGDQQGTSSDPELEDGHVHSSLMDPLLKAGSGGTQK